MHMYTYMYMHMYVYMYHSLTKDIKHFDGIEWDIQFVQQMDLQVFMGFRDRDGSRGDIVSRKTISQFFFSVWISIIHKERLKKPICMIDIIRSSWRKSLLAHFEISPVSSQFCAGASSVM